MAAPGPSYPILWVADSPLSKSAYGQQTALFVPRLQALGHHIDIFAANHTGEALNWKDTRILPRYNDRIGNDLLLQHSRHTVGDEGVNILLHDIWTYEPTVLAKTGRIAAWTPVDHVPLQTVTDRCLTDAGGLADPPHIIPLAMSRFAQESFAAKGFDAPYVPHAYDPVNYQPRDRKRAKELLQVPEDAFVVAVVADNQGIGPPRKAWGELLSAFAEFHKVKKDAVIYLHTDMLGVRGGLDLFQILASLDVPVEAIHVCDPYEYRVNSYSPEFLSYVYSAADVLLNPSYGEGFGCTIMEAGACGTPQIVGDNSAMSEVGYGWKVGGQKWWTALGGWQVCPSIPEIIEALKHAYNQSESRREKAQRHAAQYEVSLVMREHMVPALAELGRRFEIA
jgi:glycosyltransferase involved in cell wall biosynthesis